MIHIDKLQKQTVWRVTFPSGESCHFGVASSAYAYARKTGKVEAITLHGRPELRAVEESHIERLERELAQARQEAAHWKAQAESLARAVMADQTGAA